MFGSTVAVLASLKYIVRSSRNMPLLPTAMQIAAAWHEVSLLVSDRRGYLKKFRKDNVLTAESMETEVTDLFGKKISRLYSRHRQSKWRDMELRLHWINGIIMLLKGRKSALLEDSTEKIINSLSYDKLKNKISEERKEQLKLLNVVSNDENAIWLIDYWCGKDIRGLIQMPFSRHWIMHIEASLRIKNKIYS